MKREILVCDRCGQGQEPTADPVYSYKIDMGSEMDPSGNGYNTIWDYKDFCTSCVSEYQAKHKHKMQPI